MNAFLTTFFLVFSFLLQMYAHALVNPFSCKRPVVLALPIQENALTIFKLVGIVGSNNTWRALIKHDEEIYTISAGESLAGANFLDIDSESVKLSLGSREIVLRMEDE